MQEERPAVCTVYYAASSCTMAFAMYTVYVAPLLTLSLSLTLALTLTLAPALTLAGLRRPFSP